MQQQEELEEEENMPEQDLDPLVLDNDGSVVPASQASWTKIESGAVEAVDVSEAPGDEEISENSTEDTFSDGSTDGDFDTNKNISDNAATEAGSEDIQTADGSISFIIIRLCDVFYITVFLLKLKFFGTVITVLRSFGKFN